MRDLVNDMAQKKFAELRTKFKLDVVDKLDKDKKIVAKSEKLTEEEFQEFINEPIVKEVDEQKKKEVDSMFDYIESLNLPSNLSLAIGLIISGHKVGNKEDYAKAIDAIQKEVLKYG